MQPAGAVKTFSAKREGEPVSNLILLLSRGPAMASDRCRGVKSCLVSRASRDLFLAQRFARHVSPLTRTIYTHPSDQELWEGVRRLNC